MIANYNMFTYGEVGNRLLGMRDSEIYKQSAKKIENFIINEIGNLKIATDFDKKDAEVNVNPLALYKSKNGFYITVIGGEIVTLTHNLKQVIARRKIETRRGFRFCDEKLFSFAEDSTGLGKFAPIEVYEFEYGKIGVSNFPQLMRLPIEEKENIKLDIYRIYHVQSDVRVSLLGSYTNPKLDTSNGQIRLEGSSLVLSRIYKEYKANVSKENIDTTIAGFTFGVLHNYQTPDNDKKYVLGNTEINFTGEGRDNKYGGNYFTSMSARTKGELIFGKLIRINGNVTTLGIYQDRLLIVHKGTFYFSKKSNYLDFRNDTQADSAFFFKPTPINNIYPEIYNVLIGDKIFVPNSMGVYVISSNNILSSGSYSVFIGSEIPCERGYDKYVLLDNTFYYITTDRKLRAVEQVPNSQGIESYSSTMVEKYDIDIIFFDSIWKFTYNNKKYLALKTGLSYIEFKLYEQLDYKLFRSFTLKPYLIYKDENSEESYREYDCENFYFYDKYIFVKKRKKEKLEIWEESRSLGNMLKGTLILNPPYLSTEKGGHYNNDFSSRIERVFIKILGKYGIKGLKIGDHYTENKPLENDLLSVYKVETSRRVLNGFEIELFANRVQEIEILGIDLKVLVAGD